MERFINVAGAQLGPIARDEPRQQVVRRLIELMREAKARGCELVVFPELALTTFFPRWWMEDEAEIDSYFEREMPGPATRPLFDAAQASSASASISAMPSSTHEDGASRRFNTSILVDQDGRIVGKYRKVHLPGHAEHEP